MSSHVQFLLSTILVGLGVSQGVGVYTIMEVFLSSHVQLLFTIMVGLGVSQVELVFVMEVFFSSIVILDEVSTIVTVM